MRSILPDRVRCKYPLAYPERKDVVQVRLVSTLAEDAGLTGAAVALRQIDGADVVPEPILTADGDGIAAASTIKVPIGAALAEAYAAGTLRPADRVEIRAENMTPNDLPSPFVPGYAASLEELLRFMIARSDNVATNTLIDVLGREAIDTRARAWGLRATAVRRKLSGALPLIADPGAHGRNAYPPDDAALLFERIARDAVFAPLFSALEAQEWNEKLSRGLEPGDRFAHKTGDTDEVTHDGGILTVRGDDGRERRYAIAVALPLPSTSDADQRMARFMRALRPWLAVSSRPTA